MNFTEQLLTEMVASNAPESETLEFKRELPATKSHDEKAEFAKDVVGMANNAGGVILYGISTYKDCASAVMPILGESADAASRRLTQVLAGAIEPKELRLRFQTIDLAGGGFVLAVSVPRSFAGPYRVVSENRSHFYYRSNTQVRQLTYNELREAFLGRERAAERFAQWRRERVALVKQNHGPRAMTRNSPLAVVHAAPLEAFERSVSIDPTPFQQEPAKLMYGVHKPTDWNYNLDGLVAFFQPRANEAAREYAQFHRAGRVEAVSNVGFDEEGERTIAGPFVAAKVRKSLIGYSTLFSELGFNGPMIYALALLNVGGAKMATDWVFFEKPTADRDDLHLPEALVMDMDAIGEDVDAVARPILNTLWQGFGVAACDRYDPDTGQFRP